MKSNNKRPQEQVGTFLFKVVPSKTSITVPILGTVAPCRGCHPQWPAVVTVWRCCEPGQVNEQVWLGTPSPRAAVTAAPARAGAVPRRASQLDSESQACALPLCDSLTEVTESHALAPLARPAPRGPSESVPHKDRMSALAGPAVSFKL